MLQNDFYQVHDLVSNDHSIHCQITFNQEHDIFKSHFPQQPVVPGVCTMQIIKSLLETQMRQKLRLLQAAQVKFLQLIVPQTRPAVEITWTVEGDNIGFNATIRSEGAPVFKMNGTLARSN